MRRTSIALATAILAGGLGLAVAQADSGAAVKAPFIRHSVQRNVGPGETAIIRVPCDPGTVPTGGGFNNSPGVDVLSSFAQPDNWTVVVNNPSNIFKQAESHVICSTP
ncbi:hypothetical protein FHS38_004189 [Streptomyces netropsis]|uniref:Uncharacterized protein n=1 Tax=Streptomyces netropsis TaxID=55404 RepID=A0A7W7LED2_STRNE|nr:hypothetical protein [Streptomyces netropsis]